MDGDPYEVAGRSVRQAEAVAVILLRCIELASVQARNAEMERAFASDDEPQAGAWDTSPQGRRFSAAHGAVEKVRQALDGLAKAAGYNPKKPPKE